MKKIIIIVACVLVVSTAAAVILPSIVDSPVGTIERFEECYNNLDLEGMINCFDPRIQSLYAGANAFVGELTGGLDLSSMPGLALLLSEFTDEEMPEPPQIDIEVTDWEKTSDETAVVYCIITTTMYGESESAEGELPMVKYDDEWFISGDDFIDSLF